MINAIQAWTHGFGARVTSVSEGSFSLLSAPGSKLATMADLRRPGGSVKTGLLQSSIVNYLTQRMMESNGADPKRIELVPIVALPARLEMLLAGRIDAACLPEPLATVALARGAHRLADTEEMGTTPGVILFTAKALAEKSSEVARFYRAYDRAVAEINANGESYRGAIVAGWRVSARRAGPDADSALPPVFHTDRSSGLRCHGVDEGERTDIGWTALRGNRRPGVCGGCWRSVTAQPDTMGNRSFTTSAFQFPGEKPAASSDPAAAGRQPSSCWQPG